MKEEDLIELSEVTLKVSIDELDKIISFFKEVREKHASTEVKEGFCHSHYRDWDKNWETDSPDIIVVTT